MRTRVDIVQVNEVADGYGGATETVETISTFYAVPERTVIQLSATQKGSVTDTQGLTSKPQVQMLANVPVDDIDSVLFRVNGELYKAVDVQRVRRRYSYTLEGV